MPTLLHIETSGEFCSVAVSKATTLLTLKETNEEFTHAKTITVFIDECIREAGLKLTDLDAVVVSMGPGSYTGLRVGLSAAKGICYALDKPLIGVSTLQALAWGARDQLGLEAVYVPMIDARRMEVYTAEFDSNLVEIVSPSAMILENDPFAEKLARGKDYVFCGNGAAKAEKVIEAKNATFLSLESSARFMIELGVDAWENKKFEKMAYCEPFYLKRPNITKPKPNVLLKTMNDKKI